MKKPLVTNYVARKRLSLILEGIKHLDKKKTKILDVGCGNGYFVRALREQGFSVIGIDKFGKKDGQWIENDPDFIMDAKKMKFKSNAFDVVIALEVIEHCDCASEIKRVMKPNGLFFCSTPSPGTDWVRTILVSTRMLEDQDFEGHDHIIDLRKVPLNLVSYKKMFLGTSQFGVFTK